MCNANMDIPDAPWIRDAETYGMPEAEDVSCPVCYAENPEWIMTDACYEEICCSECAEQVDAWDYMDENCREKIHGDGFNCPMCGGENPEYFYIPKKGKKEILCCDICGEKVDPWQYMADRKNSIRRCWA